MHPCASQHFINSYLLFGFLTLSSLEKKGEREGVRKEKRGECWLKERRSCFNKAPLKSYKILPLSKFNLFVDR